MKTQRYIRNVALSGLMLMVAIASIPAQAKTVEVPAGSVNALPAAVAEAGPHGTVLLQSGVHSESGEVLVTLPIRIQGQPGAIHGDVTLVDTSVDPCY